MNESQSTPVFELAIFLLLLMPGIVLGIFGPPPEPEAFPILSLAAIAQDFSWVALIAYLLWRNGEGPGNIGWVRKNLWKEVSLGTLLFVPMSAAAFGLDSLLGEIGLSGSRVAPSFLEPRRGAEMVLAVVLVVVVAIAEESVFRGFLLLRIRQASGSIVVAVLGSAVVFGLGHGYEGPRGMVTVGSMGLVLAVVYAWRKSLVAPAVMHFLQDFSAIVLPPLLAGTGAS